MRTLLIRPGAIGDCIRHFPEMEALRGEYTEVWISRPLVPLVQFADRVRAIADTGIELAGLPGLPLPAELASFDRIYSWYGTRREEFRQAVAHLPFTFFPALPTAPPTAVPHIGLEGPRHGEIVIHPFSGSAKKNWPLGNFRALAARLPNVAWTCGPEEDLPGATRFDNLADLARWLADVKGPTLWAYAAAADGEVGLWDADLTGGVALVLGAEGKGVRPLVRRTCDGAIAIPLAAGVESLNVSAAAAVALHAIARRRNERAQ